MKKVSVVVPIHNAESRLTDCLSSIKNQTLKDIEIICVDDASADCSVDIIRSFMNEDSRFILLENNECIGAGRTRNRGLKIAEGEFVVFWDSDEFYVESLLEKMYDAAINFNAEVVLAERGILNSESNCVVPEASAKYMNSGYGNAAFSIKELPENGLSMWPSSPVNRMVRRTLIDRYHIEFQDLRSSNDVFYADMTTLLADKIIHINDWSPMIYVYRGRAGSISSNRNPFCSYEAFKKIKDVLEEMKKWEEYHRYVCTHFISAIFSELKKCHNEEMQKEYFDFIKDKGFRDIFDGSDYTYFVYDSRYAERLRLLLYADFSIKCWDKNYRLRKALMESRERLKEVVNYFVDYNLKVGIWQCGEATEDINRFFEHNFKYRFCGVLNENSDLLDVDVIMVFDATSHAFLVNRAESEGRRIRLFDLNNYISVSSFKESIYIVGATLDILTENRDRLEELFRLLHGRGIKVAAWGADTENFEIVRYIYENFQYEFYCIVDVNEEERETADGQKVISLSKVSDEVDVIMITHSNVNEEIIRRIRRENCRIQIIYLYEFIKAGKDDYIESLIVSKSQLKQIKEYNRLIKCLENNSTQVEELLLSIKDKRAGLWGAGKWGYALTKFAEEKHLYPFSYIIDNNPYLVGSKIGDMEVVDFDSIAERIEVIIITGKRFKNEISEQINRKNAEIKIVNLQDCLTE